MCECGCGEFRPLGKIRVKGGWHAIEVYPGCAECGTTWGLTVRFLSAKDEDTAWLLEGVPLVAFDQRGEWNLPILDTDLLRKQFAADVGGDDDLSEANFALDEFVSRGGLKDVHHKTVQQFREKSAPRPPESPNHD